MTKLYKFYHAKEVTLVAIAQQISTAYGIPNSINNAQTKANRGQPNYYSQNSFLSIARRKTHVAFLALIKQPLHAKKSQN